MFRRQEFPCSSLPKMIEPKMSRAVNSGTKAMLQLGLRLHGPVTVDRESHHGMSTLKLAKNPTLR
jgi:hypothetical protein